MFWKRKRPKPASEVALELDEKREHYRVRLPPEMPAVLEIDGELCTVRDLSAGGIAFLGPRSGIGTVLRGRLLLGRQKLAIPTELVVVDVDFEQVNHASYHGLGEDAQAAINRFVLEVQKYQIRTTREHRVIEDKDL